MDSCGSCSFSHRLGQKPWPIAEAWPAAPSTATLLANIFQYSSAGCVECCNLYKLTLSPSIFGHILWAIFGVFSFIYFFDLAKPFAKCSNYAREFPTRKKNPFRARTSLELCINFAAFEKGLIGLSEKFSRQGRRVPAHEETRAKIKSVIL